MKRQANKFLATALLALFAAVMCAMPVNVTQATNTDGTQIAFTQPAAPDDIGSPPTFRSDQTGFNNTARWILPGAPNPAWTTAQFNPAAVPKLDHASTLAKQRAIAKNTGAQAAADVSTMAIARAVAKMNRAGTAFAAANTPPDVHSDVAITQAANVPFDYGAAATNAVAMTTTTTTNGANIRGATNMNTGYDGGGGNLQAMTGAGAAFGGFTAPLLA